MKTILLIEAKRHADKISSARPLLLMSDRDANREAGHLIVLTRLVFSPLLSMSRLK